MKSKQATRKVLLDTAFLFPSLGIDAGVEVSKGLKILSDTKSEIYYSSSSILESLWIAARLLRSGTFDRETFSLGLRSIIEGGRYEKAEENSEIFNDALRLYLLGHKDMVDNILYASSTQLNLKLLTLDNEFREFIHERRLKDTLISPDELTH